jgi:hypothetical protein
LKNGVVDSRDFGGIMQHDFGKAGGLGVFWLFLRFMALKNRLNIAFLFDEEGNFWG